MANFATRAKPNTLDLQLSHKMNLFWPWLIAAVVALASIRGIIVIHSDLPVNAVYLSVAALLLMLAIYGYLQRKKCRNRQLILLKNLLKLNLLLGAANMAVDLYLGNPRWEFVYLVIAPYIVFLFLRVPARYFHASIVVIAVAIGCSVFGGFIDYLEGPAGFEKIAEYNARLRPETFQSLNRDLIVRPGGYTGSNHDSANILGMMVTFFFIRFLVRRKFLDLGLALFAMVGIALTQSASNIVVAILTVVIFAGYLMYRNRSISSYVYLFLGVIGAAVLIAVSGDAMTNFATRLGPEGDWTTMLSFTEINFLSEFGFILFGHGATFNSVITGNEISLILFIGHLGIIHATILYWILLYPLFSFVKLRSMCLDAVPYVAVIFFGFFSLLHYGSLFRVTNIFLFYAFYAMCLNAIMTCRSYTLLPRSPTNVPEVAES